MSIKRILSVFGALITLAVVGALVWISTFNPNDYKALAVEQAQKAGWKLTINGDLSMSLWPQLAIDLPPIELAALNANQSIAAQDAQVSLAMAPLLFERRAEASTLILQSPVIRWDLDAAVPGGGGQSDSGSQSSSDALAFAVGGLELTNADIRLFNGQTLAHDLQISEMTLGTISPDAWVPASFKAQYTAPGLPKIPLQMQAKIRTSADFSLIDVRALQLSALDLSVSGELSLVPNPLSVMGQLSVDAFDAKSLAKRFGATIATQNPDALKNVGLNLTLGEGGPVYASALTLNLDNTRFTGEAGLRSLSPLQFNAILTGDRLILDDYLAPASDVSSDSVESDNGTTDAVSPLAGLAGIDGDLRLELAQLEASGLQAERIEVAAEIRDRRIHLTQLAADLYEGQLLGQAVLNGRTAVPSMSADLSLSSLQIQGLLSDLADFSDLSGMTGLQANLTAEGLDAQSIMASLNGNASGEILNGGYKGIAIDSLICDGIATLTGGQSKLASGDTAFDAVRFNTDIVNGFANFDTLKAGLVNLAVDGSGQVDLAGQRLNLVLDAGLTGDQQITGCAVPSFVQNAKLPLKCQGGFADDPAGLCGFDSSRADSLISDQLKAVAKAKEDELKAKIKAKIESKKDEFEAKLKEKAAEKLKSLFR